MGLIKQIFKSHLKSILIFFFSVNILIMTTTIIVYDAQLRYMEDNIEFNIEEYGEIDRDHLCSLLECKMVVDYKHNKLFKKTNRLHNAEWIDYASIQLWRNLYLLDYKITIYNEAAESYFILGNDILIMDIILMMTIMIPIIMILFLYPMIVSIKREKESAIMHHVGNEALLANKSMIMITENIHHELNTPLEIIDNKIEKIHRVISDYLVAEHVHDEEHGGDILDAKRDINKRLVKLTPDFEFIRTASEQIYNILEKMKGFKHMRYSNGNKTVDDIFESAFKIISISNSNYDYVIDKRLQKYSIHASNFKNADLLGIIINNIKNSLEASTSKIYIMLNGYSKGRLKIRIIDNGAGIPKEIIKKVFEPNFSTKSTDNTIRGNGMYLNKQILKQVGGDTYIVESSPKGTTLELIVPVVKREDD